MGSSSERSSHKKKVPWQQEHLAGAGSGTGCHLDAKQGIFQAAGRQQMHLH
jgi:hypothetical protein